MKYSYLIFGFIAFVAYQIQPRTVGIWYGVCTIIVCAYIGITAGRLDGLGVKDATNALR